MRIKRVKRTSGTGTRTLVWNVRGPRDNHLHYTGCVVVFVSRRIISNVSKHFQNLKIPSRIEQRNNSYYLQTMYCIYKLQATKAIQYVPRYQAHTYGTAPYSPLLPSHQTCLETTRTRTVCRPIYSTLPMHPAVVYQVKSQFYVSGGHVSNISSAIL